ncbi:MAG: ATP-binding protein [Bacteroidaceae bacterium]|nr:ATP-binding protein [Bacteroidaceae bacterium]
MKFYDREKEISELQRLDDLSFSTAQFTVLMGRRRTGKTTLMTHALQGRKYLYFFIGKKAEQIQCTEFQKQTMEVLGLKIHGQVSSFPTLLEEILVYSKQEKVTVIIDEFQRLEEIGDGIISDIQEVWDRHQAEAHIHLIACGSIYNMMKKIFEDRKEPLFGRKTARIDLKPFSTSVLKQILHDYHAEYTPEDLLMLYAVTGGVAKYVAQLMDDGCKTWHDILHHVCRPSSIFIEEGTELLVGEFGRKFQIYYSILQLIASGMTSQAEIDSIIEKNCGRYLDTLESEYSLIKKRRPMWAKPNSQGVRFYIDDCFLMFWFRFFEKNRTLVELGKFDLLEESILSEYTQFSGFVLEKYFRQLYGERDRVTEVSHWWDNQGENEIDLIALERLDHQATIAEVKRNPSKINLQALGAKYEHIKKNLRGYKVNFIGLSMRDM